MKSHIRLFIRQQRALSCAGAATVLAANIFAAPALAQPNVHQCDVNWQNCVSRNPNTSACDAIVMICRDNAPDRNPFIPQRNVPGHGPKKSGSSSASGDSGVFGSGGTSTGAKGGGKTLNN